MMGMLVEPTVGESNEKDKVVLAILCRASSPD